MVFLIFKIPAERIPPPFPPVLPAIVLLTIVSVRARPLSIAPPSPAAVLPDKVLLMTVAIPSLATAPPSPVLVLPLSVITVSVKVPLFSMPPPRAPLPPLMVKLFIATVVPVFTVNIRLKLLPLTLILLAPVPLMFTLFEITSWVPPSVIVQTGPTQPPSVPGILNVIVFVSTFAFAAATASRRLQSASQRPSLVSAVLVTTKFGVGSTVMTTSLLLVPPV